ncbi:hypothetical protein ACS0TY_026664 [Phlomoides rotata]
MLSLVEEFFFQKIIVFILLSYISFNNNNRRVRRLVGDVQPYGMLAQIPNQVRHMNWLFTVSELDCISDLRMNQNSFAHLYFMMRELGRLVDHRYVSVEEQVSMFLSILTRHKKNQVIKFHYLRSCQTVSYYTHLVLKALKHIVLCYSQACAR